NLPAGGRSASLHRGAGEQARFRRERRLPDDRAAHPRPVLRWRAGRGSRPGWCPRAVRALARLDRDRALIAPRTRLPSPVDICTIIAKNYVAYARVLARSFREHHPDSRCFTLVIDDVAGYLDPADEPFELITPDQLDLDGFELMAARYEVLELST